MSRSWVRLLDTKLIGPLCARATRAAQSHSRSAHQNTNKKTGKDQKKERHHQREGRIGSREGVEAKDHRFAVRDCQNDGNDGDRRKQEEGGQLHASSVNPAASFRKRGIAVVTNSAVNKNPSPGSLTRTILSRRGRGKKCYSEASPLFSRSRNSLPVRKNGTRFSSTETASPVRGLR